VETLGSWVFLNSPLESVNLGSGLKIITSYAFFNTKLKSITIPPTVKEIGQGAFGNTQLTDLEIPNSVTVIENEVFIGITTLARISIPDGLLKLGPWAFERNYSLTSILYCGKLTGFPITPTCPPERQTVIDAKAAADKAAADKAAADKAAADKAAADKAAGEARITAANKKYSALSSEIDRLLEQYPSKKSEIELYKKKLALFERIDQVNVATIELNLAGIESKLVAMSSIYGKVARTITCTKGKQTKKVTDVSPKCPAGYKKK
jgi:hypothetical protein